MTSALTTLAKRVSPSSHLVGLVPDTHGLIRLEASSDSLKTGTDGSNSVCSANESSGFRDSLLSCVKNAHLAGNPALQVHRRTAHVGVQTRVLENSLCLHF